MSRAVFLSGLFPEKFRGLFRSYGIYHHARSQFNAGPDTGARLDFHAEMLAVVGNYLVEKIIKRQVQRVKLDKDFFHGFRE